MFITDEISSIESINCDSFRYDLTVESNHNFFAEGILVHNCQSMFDTLLQWHLKDPSFEPEFVIEEKLDGTSFTCYIDPETDEFCVCSRNINLKEEESNTYWKVARENNLETILRETGHSSIAIQGEIVGPGVQKNIYGLDALTLFVFDIWDIKEQTYWSFNERKDFCETTGLRSVPVVSMIDKVLFGMPFIGDSGYDTEEDVAIFISWALAFAEGKSLINPKTEREGLVFKNLKDPLKSFKAISNKFLLKESGE